MPSIKPVSDLRNYTEVLNDCTGGQPVFLTRNGHGRYVLLDMEEYDRQQAKLELFAKLAEGEASVQSEKDWLSTQQLRSQLGV
ncbi:MAG: type II toxin-antitoxin system Phd/YefM family antitoxin [Clostridia bacterium]|nr:type II toxin-antitoxin system Phd/YefM family antitoxin [Clostridia bacterium]